MPGFTHIDKQGEVRMVDVTAKALTSRVAVAQGVVAMNPDTFESIMNQTAKKGNVLETARIAPLNITHIKIDFFPEHTTTSIRIEALAGIVGQTGVEMEALTAVSVAALTIYDMCKSTDREMRISDIYLLEKSGGKSGKFLRGK
ncbi:MAG: cyclic pyranopterin monophosphate synthase MoaC [Deltaproteobacteria bacterium]|nr:cyclic pyranopterin monophosphate synthase MoaC [Deltaproteobacteria bacterium]